MLSVLRSRKSSCTDPAGVVLMRSLCTTRAPTFSVVVLPPGGVHWESGLTAAAVPTSWAKTGAAAKAGPASSIAMVFSSSMLASEFECRPGADLQIAHVEHGQIRHDCQVLHPRGQVELIVDRNVDAERDTPFDAGWVVVGLMNGSGEK